MALHSQHAHASHATHGIYLQGYSTLSLTTWRWHFSSAALLIPPSIRNRYRTPHISSAFSWRCTTQFQFTLVPNQMARIRFFLFSVSPMTTRDATRQLYKSLYSFTLCCAAVYEIRAAFSRYDTIIYLFGERARSSRYDSTPLTASSARNDTIPPRLDSMRLNSRLDRTSCFTPLNWVSTHSVAEQISFAFVGVCVKEQHSQFNLWIAVIRSSFPFHIHVACFNSIAGSFATLYALQGRARDSCSNETNQPKLNKRNEDAVADASVVDGEGDTLKRLLDSNVFQFLARMLCVSVVVSVAVAPTTVARCYWVIDGLYLLSVIKNVIDALMCIRFDAFLDSMRHGQHRAHRVRFSRASSCARVCVYVCGQTVNNIMLFPSNNFLSSFLFSILLRVECGMRLQRRKIKK